MTAKTTAKTTRPTRSRKAKTTEAVAPEAPASESPAPAAPPSTEATAAAAVSTSTVPPSDDFEHATVAEFADESAPPADAVETAPLKEGETVVEGDDEAETGKVLIPQEMIIPPAELSAGRALIDPRTMFLRNNCATFEGREVTLGIRAFLEAGRGDQPIIAIGATPTEEDRGARFGYVRSTFNHPPKTVEQDGDLMIRSAKVMWVRRRNKPEALMPLLGGEEIRARPYALVKFSTLAEANVDDLFRGRIEKTGGAPRTLCYGQTGKKYRWQQQRVMALQPGADEVTVTDSIGVSYRIAVDNNWRVHQVGEALISLVFLNEQLENAKGMIERAWKELAAAKNDERRRLIGRMMAGGYLATNAALIAAGGEGNPNWWPEVLQILGMLAKENLLAGQLGDYVDTRCPNSDSLREFHKIRDAVGRHSLDLRSILSSQPKPRPRKR